jgi:hypothetical protein
MGLFEAQQMIFREPVQMTSDEGLIQSTTSKGKVFKGTQIPAVSRVQVRVGHGLQRRKSHSSRNNRSNRNPKLGETLGIKETGRPCRHQAPFDG